MRVCGVVFSVLLGCGVTSETGDSGTTPAGGPSESAVPVGVFGYSTGPGGAFELLGADGSVRASIVVSSEDGAGFSAAIADQAVRAVRYHALEDGGTWVISQASDSAGALLVHETRLDADGQVVESALRAPLADGAPAPAVGAIRDTPEGRWSVFPVVGTGADVVAPGAVGAWLQATGAGNAIDSEAALLLTAALQDPAFVQRVTDQQLGDEPGTVEAALHRTDSCRDLATKATASTHECCQKCTNFEGNAATLAQGALSFFGGVEMALRMREGCICCQKALGLDLAKVVDCLKSATSKDAETEATCAQKLQPKAWERVSVTDFGHGCETACDTSGCANWCKSELQAYNGGCWAGTCVCAFEEVRCTDLFPDIACGDLVLAEAGTSDLFCRVAECGDGVLVTNCQHHPELSEVCDKAAPVQQNGCMCSDDCKKCDPCECDQSAPAAWPEGKVCDEHCRLVEEPPCEEDILGFFASNGAWCDPKASAAWCGEGKTCAADTCRCEEDETPADSPPTGAGPSCGTGCTPCIGSAGALTRYACDSLDESMLVDVERWGSEYERVAVAGDGWCYDSAIYFCCGTTEPHFKNTFCDSRVTTYCHCCEGDTEKQANNVSCMYEQPKDENGNLPDAFVCDEGWHDCP